MVNNKKSSKRSNEQKKKQTYINIVIFFVISTFALLSLLFSTQIENFINKEYYEQLNVVNNSELTFNRNDLTISFVSVGSADGIVIELPDNKVMVIDSGTNGKSKQSLLDYLANSVYNKRHNNILDYYIITHPDLDHFAGTKELTIAYKIKNIYRPKVLGKDEKTIFENDGLTTIEDNYKVKYTSSYNTAINAIYDEVENDGAKMFFDETGIIISNNESNMEYTYKFTFLSPDEYVYMDGNEIEENSYSAVLMLEYKNKNILLTGDATGVIENEVMMNAQKFGINLKSDVLKVAHHGSATNGSNSIDFLNEVAPSYAIISCEEGKYNNLPSLAIIQRIEDAGVPKNNILRTDLNGTILVGFSTTNVLMVFAGDEIISNLKTIVFIHWYYAVIAIITLAGVILIKPIIKL